jgi:hypothetical protein
MGIETTSCGHLHHPNCLHVHLQESTCYKKYWHLLHPLWFDSKGIRCVENEEYENQKVALGCDEEVNIWLEHSQIVANYPGGCPLEKLPKSFLFVLFIDVHML